MGASSRDWDAAYAKRGVEGVSWFQQEPRMSLALLDALGTPTDAAVIDVGGGASLFAARLAERGFHDLTVLDLSTEALTASRAEAGDTAAIRWITADILSWQPPRRYDLWHDRAVLHFLVDDTERDRYLEQVAATVAPGGAVIVGAFAPDGPSVCSGLPVRRYAADELASLFDGFELVEARREEHVTPGGATQPFTWIAARSQTRGTPTF